MQWANAKGPALLSIVVASKAVLFFLGDLPSGVFVLELGLKSELREVRDNGRTHRFPCLSLVSKDSWV